MSQAWKNLERLVAKKLSGVRIGRGADFSKSLPDVVAPAGISLPRTNGYIIAECKYSYKNSWVNLIEDNYKDRVIKVCSDKDIYLFCPLDDIRKFIDPDLLVTQKLDRKIPDYIKRNFAQCAEYMSNIHTDIVLRANLYQKLNVLAGKTTDNFLQIKPMLPIVVLGKTRTVTRVCYTTLTALTAYYYNQSTNYHDKNKGNI